MLESEYYQFIEYAFNRFSKEGRHFNASSLNGRLIQKYDIFKKLRKRKHSKKILNSILTFFKQDFTDPDIILEFGVYKGGSINLLANRFPKTSIHGFDSFDGFPNDGRKDWQQDFKCNPPRVRKNVILHTGYFSETLPSFKKTLDSRHIKLIHIDCDIYSSTKDIFNNLSDNIKEGTVIIFDELINYKGFLNNEMKALYEFLQEKTLRFEWYTTFGNKPSLHQPPYAGMKEYRENGLYQQCAIIIKNKS